MSSSCRTSRRRAATALTAVVVLLVGLLGLTPSPASAAGGTLEGIVTGSSGDPVAFTVVTVTSADDPDDQVTVYTDEVGAYTVGGLAAGDYRVFAEATGFDTPDVSTYYDGAVDAESATLVEVSDDTTTTVDVELLRGAKITGVITSSANVPVDGVDVSLVWLDGVDQEGDYLITSTNSAGRYSFVGVPAGRFLVYVAAAGADMTTYFGGTSSAATATEIVTAVGETSTADVKLLRGARISGTVTASGGVAIGDVDVTVSVLTDECATCFEYAGSDSTDSAGRYTVTGLPAGTFRVGFDSLGYQPEYFDNARTLETATDIVLPAAGSRTGVDARLATGATVSGIVRDNHGDPVRGVFVSAAANGSDPDADPRGVTTATNGKYTIGGLPTGTYTLTADGTEARYTSASTTRTLTSPQTISGVDFTLTRLSVISGRVTAGSGAILSDVVLRTYQKVTSSGGAVTYVEDPDIQYQPSSGGTYRVYAPIGTYRISATGYDDFAGQVDATTFYPSAPSVATGSDIPVTALEQQVTDKDITLLDDVTISGTVTPPAGTTDESPDIQVLDAATGEPRSEVTYPESDGSYVISGLTAGSYRVQFNRAGGASVLAAQYYDGVSEGAGLTAATVLTLTSGQTRTGVDAVLSRGSVLTGRVLRSDGSPAAGCRVQAFTTSGALTTRPGTTADDGTFRVPGLSAGDYQVVVNDEPDRDAAWACVGKPVPPGDGLPGPGYYTAADGTLAPTSSDLRSVTVAASGDTSLPVDLRLALIPDPPVENVAAPTITGTPRVGEPLTATTGTWNPADVTYSYRWQVAGTDAGADQATYTPEPADEGKTVTVTVTASKDGYASGVSTSSATDAVLPAFTATITNSVPPKVTGQAKVGRTLSAAVGTYSPDGLTFARQWLRNGTAISGATGSTYRVVAADVGRRLSVRVTASRADAEPLTLTSAATAAAVKGSLTLTGTAKISGTPRVGRSVKVSTPRSSPSARVTYQWLRSGRPIRYATSSIYRVARGDRGKRLSVTITYTLSGYTTATKKVGIAKAIT